jgi:glycosyltransferase involved in cell wall biosynthesis
MDGQPSVKPQTQVEVGETPEVSVIIPAFNEAAVVGGVVTQVRGALAQIGGCYEVLVVDDGSADETAAVAAAAGAAVIRHPYNIGNGAAVKTGIRRARGKIVLMMDGDGQHDPADIGRMLSCMPLYDMVVGARTNGTGTGAHRGLANRVYNWLATYVCGRKIEDLTSGFRAVKAPIAKGFVYLLPNTFSYPTTITLAVVRAGFSLKYVPIAARPRVGKSKIKLLRDGSRFLMIILRIATLFSPLKVFLPVSVAMFLTGVLYGAYKVVILDGRYGPTSAMLMTMAVVVFMVGLVSEQVANLRFDRSGLEEPSDGHRVRRPRSGDAEVYED